MASVFTENLVGHVLDQRYALTELVGVGGSARVYRAEDRRLRRFVAVKVLHSSYTEDQGFVRRFRHEAESLAHLNHPNIVAVYDVNDGENASGEPPFLVTEFLGGGTLRALLDDGYRLSPSQTTRIALDAARGLVFAHARELVHRDIKPANLLFGDDHRIRIADFGLARALADFSKTEQSGVPIGSARYMSPEQALGRPVDGRSDVYSLALVMIEAVTGSVPFLTDTLAGTTVARLDRSVQAPFEMGPLGNIVEAAGTLDPAERLDAQGLVSALEELAKTLPRADPIPLDGSRLASNTLLIDRDPTRHLSVSKVTSGVPASATKSQLQAEKAALPTDQIARVSSVPAAESIANEQAKRTGIFDIDLDEKPATVPAGEQPLTSVDRGAVAKSPDPTDATDAKSKVEVPVAKPKKRKRVIAGVAVLAIAGAGSGIGIALSKRVPTHLVPKLAGKTIAQAKNITGPLRYTIHANESIYDSTAPTGHIISQSPEVGVRLAEKKVIEVTVSRGPEPIEVPNLDNLTVEVATGLLQGLKLRANVSPAAEASTTVDAGKIIRWTPTGAVAPGSQISLIVSSGLPTLEVPKLAGLKEAAVAGAIGTDLVVTVVKTSSDAAKGTVYGTDPPAGTVVEKGSALKVFVSTGPAFAIVPNVINLTPAQASVALRSAGFKVGNTIGPADQPVLHTRPLRNTRARRGATVTLYTTEENVPVVPGVTDGATTTKAPPRVQVTPLTTSPPATPTTEAAQAATSVETTKP